jgi:predicted Zn-dependent protease
LGTLALRDDSAINKDRRLAVIRLLGISSVLLAALFSAGTAAQAPEAARPLAAGSGDEAFRNAAAARYRAILDDLARGRRLDQDRVLLERVRQIAAGLIAAAKAVLPEVAAWPWEVHVASDPAMGTFCMAGGKILVASSLVIRLDLEDGELAALLGHEIAHALADHRREVQRASIDTDVMQEIRQAEIATKQEFEADQIGIGLAHRAGWPAPGIVGFYEKLARDEPPGTFQSSHPAAVMRLEMARETAAKLPR